MILGAQNVPKILRQFTPSQDLPSTNWIRDPLFSLIFGAPTRTNKPAESLGIPVHPRLYYPKTTRVEPFFYYKNHSPPGRNSRNESCWWSLNLQPRYHQWPKQNKLQRYRTSTFCSTSLVKVPFGCSPFGHQQILVLIVVNPIRTTNFGIPIGKCWKGKTMV